MRAHVLGIDIGGTGSRAALAELPESSDLSELGESGQGGEPSALTGSVAAVLTLTGPRVEIGPEGSNVLVVARRLVAAAKEAWPDRFGSVVGIGIGATGIASLAEDPTSALDHISRETGAPAAAAIDAVTAHLGALGGRGGAITVLGTGAIAIAHPGPNEQGVMSGRWCRADGWGHLFGDRGGGAWLGRCALELALRTHDGVDSSGQSLLDAATTRFGPPASWPAQFYTRSDRAGLLAEFATDIAALARAGDAMAIELLSEAGREAARSALAAAKASTTAAAGVGAAGRRNSGEATAATPATAGASAPGDGDQPLRLALSGGLAQAGEALLSGFREEVARRHAHAIIEESAGDPLAGSLTLARLAAERRVRAQDKVLWC